MATLGDAGTSVTVMGSDFVAASTVEFAGTPLATTFTNSTTLQASFTATQFATAGAFSVTVVNPTPGGGTSTAITFTVNNPSPTLTSLSVDTVEAFEPGFTLVLTGLDFQAGSVVRVDGVDRATVFIDDTTLTIEITAAELLTPTVLAISVNNPAPGGGDSLGLPLTVADPIPELTGVTPDTACLDGADLVITLSGAKFNGDSVANLGTTPLPTVLVAPDALTATIPMALLALDTPGDTTVTVTNMAIDADSAAIPFSLAGPFLTPGNGLSPETLLVGTATPSIGLSGTCFADGGSVVWDRTPIATTFIAGDYTAVVPASFVSEVGTAEVYAQNPSGALSDTRTVYILGLTEVTPNEIVAGSRSTRLGVTGGGFQSGATVQLNGTPATTTFAGPNLLRATLSTGALSAPGSIRVVVQNPDGTISNGLSITINPAPVITRLEPVSALAGDPREFFVSILGDNFGQDVEVSTDGTPLPTRFLSSKRLRVEVPPDLRSAVGSVPIRVTDPRGAASNTLNLALLPPTVDSARFLVSAPSSPAQSLATLVIDGSNFAPDAEDVSVTVEGADVTVTSATSTQIMALTPASEAQEGASVVVTNFGTIGSAPRAAEQAPGFSLTQIVPSAITVGAGATQIALLGVGFDSGSTVDFGGTTLVPIATTDSSITVIVPPQLLNVVGSVPVAVVSQGARSQDVDFIVNPAISVTVVAPPAMVGEPYSFQIPVEGGTGDYIFLAPSGLPLGLELDPLTGVLSGIPLGQGTFFISIVVSDQSVVFESRQIRLSVLGDLVVPGRLSFELGSESEFDEQALVLAVGGDRSIEYQVTSNSDFLTIASGDESGTVSPGQPRGLLVRASRGDRAPGVYEGELIVADISGGDGQGAAQAAAPSTSIQVDMLINPSSPVLRPTQTGLTFVGALDGDSPASQYFGVRNRGTGSLDWEIEVNTQGFGDWLTVSPLTGASTDLGEVPLVDVAVNPASVVLPPGVDPPALYAQLTIRSPAATNSPERLTAVFDLRGANGAPAPTVAPHGLMFTSDSLGGESIRTVQVSNSSSVPIQFRTELGEPVTATGRPIEPGLFTVSADAVAVGGLANGSVEVAVEARAAGLPPGVYFNSLTFFFTSASEALPSQQVSLVLIVPPEVAAQAPAQSQDSCVPSGLILTFQSPGQGNPVRFGFPATVRIEAADDCGEPVTDGSVSVTFSNGDPQLFLSSLGNGSWEATWPQRSQATQDVSLSAFASHRTSGELRLEGTAEVEVDVVDNPAAPPVVLAFTNSAGFRESSLAPGMLSSIFGQNLALETAAATSLPLPEDLAGTSIQIGDGFGAMIFGSPNQTNVQSPFESTPNTLSPVTVFRSDFAISNRVEIRVERSQPAVFVDGNTLLAIVTDPEFRLVTPQRPVRPGDVLIAFMSGLGSVEPAVRTGFASPAIPAVTTGRVRVVVDGIEVEPLFSGLTPGFVGLYQLNFLVPEDLATEGPPHVIIQVAVDDELGPEFRIPVAGRQAAAPVVTGTDGALEAK